MTAPRSRPARPADGGPVPVPADAGPAGGPAGPPAAAAPGARVRVAVDAPQHSGLAGPLDYLADRPLPAGTLVRVPLGAREVPGIVWEAADAGDGGDDAGGVAPADGGSAPGQAVPQAPGGPSPSAPALRPVVAALEALPPLGAAWRQLVAFAAGYYQRGLGEVALAVLPPELRRLDEAALGRRLARRAKAADRATGRRQAAAAAGGGGAADARDAADAASAAGATGPAHATGAAGATSAANPAGPAAAPAPGAGPAPPVPACNAPEPSPEQQAVLERLRALAAADGAPPAVLLYGSTGSGKTEVYLRAAAEALARGRQVLVLVPEINLTPQLEARFAARFAGHRLVALHSALTPAQRLRHWLDAHLGEADLVLGTRLAIFASLPRLGLLVVDEEHDPSYKQQEGARYSARDLAVYRGRLERVPVLLGSATPSLETWQHAQTGRYLRLDMPTRIGRAPLPAVRLVDMTQIARRAGGTVLAPALLAALHERLARGEQSLLFLNRRGYAPVLQCGDCAWRSGCPHCSAWRVFHKLDRTLRCHHCGLSERVPRACPDCGNPDITPVGRGTERLEEQLAGLLHHPDGRPARVARIDADSTRGTGVLQARLGAVHDGEVDVLVGTQMIAKGHDFRRVTLVAAVNPDTGLFSSDFRAPERLFALLMQAAGRAGRDAARAGRAEMWLQTWQPQHALYAALVRHDYPAFAAAQLAERRSAGLPPFSHLALLRAEARDAAAATGFLDAAAALAPTLPDAPALLDGVLIYPPVPTAVARVADVERVQMLVEAGSRARLQRLLAAWLPALHALRRERAGPGQRILRWAVDVDPMEI